MKNLIFFLLFTIEYVFQIKIEKIFPNRGPTTGNTRIVLFSSKFSSIIERKNKDSYVT